MDNNVDDEEEERHPLPSPSPSSEATPLLLPLQGRPAQPRKLSWTSAYILIVSRMIGSSIFAAPGVVAESAGSVGLSLVVWTLGLLLAACAAAVSIEYGALLPRSGGLNVYLEYTYPRPKYWIMSVISVQVLVQSFTANNCIVFGQYLSRALPQGGGVGEKGLGLGLLVFTAVVHGVFMPVGIKIQNLLGFVKMGVIVVLMCIALFTVVRGRGSTELGVVGGGIWRGSNWGWHGVSQGLLRVYYAYAGVDNANMVLDEVRDPINMLRFVVPLALVTVFGVYLLVNLAFFTVVPIDVIKAKGELVAHEFFTRIFGEGPGAQISSLLIACCIAGNITVGVFSLARQNQEVARRSYLPLIFASSLPFGAPLGGVILNLIPSAAIILLIPSGNAYSFLLDVEGYWGQIAASAVAAGLMLLRWKRPHLHRPFRAFLPAILIYLAVCLSQVIAPFLTLSGGLARWKGGYSLVGIAIITSATLYWTIWARLLPKLLNQRLTEVAGVLSDGTTYTAIRRVPR